MRNHRLSALAACVLSVAVTSSINPAPAQAQSSQAFGSMQELSSVLEATRTLAQASSQMSSVLPAGSFPSSSLSSSRAKPSTPSQPGRHPWSQISEGLDVTMIGDLLGWHQRDVGLGATDLGIMAPLGPGQQFAVIFGDSFTGNGFGQGDWISPAGVVAHKDSRGRIIFDRPLNDDYQVRQLVNYSHVSDITLIPSDIINLDGTLYMQGMWNKGIGNVLTTQIWKSTDNGATWESVGVTSPTYMGGMGNLISWEQGPDGYIYAVSSSFKRADPVYLSRFRPKDMGNRRTWEVFNPSTGSWGATGAPILTKDVKAGEMSLRYIQGHWVLAMFNEATRSIEVRISKNLARNWNEIAPARVVVSGEGGWLKDQNENNFAQLYGGYIVPGSTLDNMDLVVSQWNTSNNSRYMATQFNVKGLDKFFGLQTQAPRAAVKGTQAATQGDQAALRVTEEAVSEDTMQRLGEELVMENAADITVAPVR